MAPRSVELRTWAERLLLITRWICGELVSWATCCSKNPGQAAQASHRPQASLTGAACVGATIAAVQTEVPGAPACGPNWHCCLECTIFILQLVFSYCFLGFLKCTLLNSMICTQRSAASLAHLRLGHTTMLLRLSALAFLALINVSHAIVCTESNMEGLLSEHATSSSCWTVLSNGNSKIIYDVTRLLSRHEGGRAVVQRLCGVDGSISFYCTHTNSDLRESRRDGDVTEMCEVETGRRSLVNSEMSNQIYSEDDLRSGSDSDDFSKCQTTGTLPRAPSSEIQATELELHNTPDDCWTVMDGVAFDITDYVHLHPGGPTPVQPMCGRNGADLFRSQALHNNHFFSQGVAAGWITVLGTVVGDFTPAETAECASDEFPAGTEVVEAAALATHKTQNDCWVVLGCGVYDLSKYKHPGGDSLVRAWCGKDATAAFQSVHPMSYVADSLTEGGELVGRVTSSLVEAAPTRQVPASEIARHSTPSDCWSCIGDQVYDLTFYHQSHEGGSAVITPMCGGDGTLILLRAHQMDVMAGIPTVGQCASRKEVAYTRENILDGAAFALYVALPFVLIAAVHLLGVRSQDALLRRPLAEPRSGAWGDFVNGYLEMPWALAGLLVLYLIITAVLWMLWAMHFREFYPHKYGVPGAAGRMAVYHIALAGYIGTRRFTWSWWLLRLPYERALKTHGVVGYVALVTSLVHGLSYLDLFKWQVPATVGSSAVPILVCLSILAPFTFPNTRVRFYGVFRITHFAAPVVLLLAVLHVFSLAAEGKLPRGYFGALLWVGSAAVMWVCDFVQTCFDAAMAPVKVNSQPVRLPSSGGDADYLAVVCTKQTRLYPGCWVSLACPAVGSALSHPFTAIVRKTGGGGAEAEMEFVIKANPGRWTHSLYSLAEGGSPLPPLVVTGPFGGGLGSLTSLSPERRAIVFVCGGVGITPAASLMNAFSEADAGNVHVIWSFRSSALCEHARPNFLHLPAENCHFHLTASEPQAAELGAGIRTGRPDVAALLDMVRRRAEATGRMEIGVFVCGPKAMVCDVLRATRDLNVEHPKSHFHVHCESFQM